MVDLLSYPLASLPTLRPNLCLPNQGEQCPASQRYPLRTLGGTRLRAFKARNVMVRRLSGGSTPCWRGALLLVE